MSDPIATAAALRRPRLLVRAARHALGGFDRDRALRRLLRSARLPVPGRAVGTLMDLEADLERTRTEGSAEYSALRHIEALSALMAEIGLAAEAAQLKASGISDFRRST